MTEPATQTMSPRDRPWLLVMVLVMLYMGAFVDRNVLSLLVDPIKSDLRLTDTQISLLLGVAFSVFYAISTIPAGLLIDRVGRRGIIASSAGAWSLLTIACGLAGNFWQLFVGRAGVGLSEAFITPTSFALIRDRLPFSWRGRAFSMMGLAPSLGGALALTAGGALIHAANANYFGSWPFFGALRPWQITLVTIGLVGLPLPLLLLLIRPDVRPVPSLQSSGPWNDLKEVAVQVRPKLAQYLLLIGYATAGSMAVFGFVAWFPAIMSRTFTISVAQVGLTSGPILLASSITGMTVCGLALDWLSVRGRSVLLFGLIANGIFTLSAAATPHAPNLRMAWVLYAATMFFAGAFYSVGATVLSQLTPAPVMGKVTVVYLLLQNVVGGGFGPTLVALISDKLLHGPNSLQRGLSLYCLLTGLIAWLLELGLMRARRDVQGTPLDQRKVAQTHPS